MQKKILIAPDKFKGSMSAGVVAVGLQEILENAGYETEVLPIADGGEGTTEVLCDALDGKMCEVEVEDALGNSVVATFAVAGETAVIEMSEASGLWRVEETGNLDPARASTFGTGQMMRVAIENHGVTRMVLGIGGSATNDGGIGMAQALGFEFLDESGNIVADVPRNFEKVTVIRSENAVQIPEVIVACDVENPLLGENGATRIYGPQKGVREDQIPFFEARFESLIALVTQNLKKPASHIATTSGAGAAGGLGFGLMAFCDATLQPGFDLIADLIDLKSAISDCDAVITGEGKLDRQTLNGKGPHGIATMAHAAGKSVFAVVGGTDGSPEISESFDGVVKIKPDDMPVEEAIAGGKTLLTSEAVRNELLRFLK